jgi:hypothetical protein
MWQSGPLTGSVLPAESGNSSLVVPAAEPEPDYPLEVSLSLRWDGLRCAAILPPSARIGAQKRTAMHFLQHPVRHPHDAALAARMGDKAKPPGYATPAALLFCGRRLLPQRNESRSAGALI